MYDIVTIGSATRDVFLESEDFKFIRSEEFAGGVGECLALGSKNEVRDIFFSTGGGATNAAVTFVRLGFKTGVVARVGNDGAGQEIAAALKKEGIDARLIQRDSRERTAYSTLLMYGPGERTVLVHRGPSNKIQATASVLKNAKAKWFYVSSLGGRLDLIKKIWEFAARNKIKIAWNPGGEELKFGVEALKPFMGQCEVFNVNREEAARLAFCEAQDDACLMDKICALVKLAVVTDGARGAYACLGASRYFVSSLGTKPRNTTGAGDAFGSGFVAGLMLKNDIDFALRLATLNADSVIRKMGAKTGILKKIPGRKVLNKVKVKIL